jgi:peptidoglycan/xylan/chitin deacetylase (PgdA/CDA1 family)
MLKRMWSLRRDAIEGVIYWSGLGAAFNAVARQRGAIILMYHSVAGEEAARFIDPPNRIAPAAFERQMAFLSRNRSVVPLAKVVEEIASGRTPGERTVCITLDDGYLDNLTVAAPILEKYRLPAILYLATGYVERGEAQWADILHWALTHRTADRLSVPQAGLAETNLVSPAGMAEARRLLHRHMLESLYEERTLLLQEVQRQLAPSGNPPRITMNWDEVREMQRRYPLFDVGGHTRDHVDLLTHRGYVAKSQIQGCRDDLRRELGIEPVHFSFPYSRWCAETRKAVVASGWSSAVGMGDGYLIGAASDPYAMPRIETPRTMTALRFKTSGAFPGALSMVGK